MAIGPFSTYAPPGVYTQTIQEPVVGTLINGLRVPVFIGTANEALYQSNFELVRGSSSSADTPIFGEDVSSRWVLAGPNDRPVLGPCNGNTVRFKVKNYPIVDGNGLGRATYDSGKVSVLVNGSEAAVASVDGPNGIITLLVPPSPNDFVTVNYYFRRKDTQITDDVSDQVSTGAATISFPETTTYNITSTTNILTVRVNDRSNFQNILLTTGSARTPAELVSDINNQIPGLSSFVSQDIEGNSRVTLLANGNIEIGNGSANGALGFDPGGGTKTNRNKTFTVFNGPIVDGRDAGNVSNVPSSVIATVNGVRGVAVTAVNGMSRQVSLAVAPEAGSVVSIQYYFNAWQDTFDYLPNSNVVSTPSPLVASISPGGQGQFTNGSDFVVINDGDQSKIVWGAAYTITTGLTTGSTSLGTAQLSARLVDNRMFGKPVTAVAGSQTRFDLGYIPTTGNGRDTPLTQSVFNSVTNGRMDLPTNNPSLVLVYVGRNWRDAYSRDPVTVLSVDGSIVTLATPVPADQAVFATFWYSLLDKDDFTVEVVTSGPTGVGQYTITSTNTGSLLFGTRFGVKTSLPETLNFPSGYSNRPDAIIYGGTPVAETVTVTFNDSLEPATHASITTAGVSPFDLYAATSSFGTITVDGVDLDINLDTPYKALLVGSPVTDSFSFGASDTLYLTIDGVSKAIDLSSSTSMADVVTAINDPVNGFNATVASEVTYGTEVILLLTSVNAAPSHNDGTSSTVAVGSGSNSVAAAVGLIEGSSRSGSWTAINQPARMVSSKSGPFTFTGSNNSLTLSVDGDQFVTNMMNGSLTTQQVVDSINDAYAVGGFLANNPTLESTVLASAVTFANDLADKYSEGGSPHLQSVVLHYSTDTGNDITASVATNLSTLVALLNNMKAKFNLHLVSPGKHQQNDTVNTVTTADATDLKSSLVLAHALQNAFNEHLEQKGIHGLDDLSNVVTADTALAVTVTSIASAIPGTGPVVVTTGSPHGLSNGQFVKFSGVTGSLVVSDAFNTSNINDGAFVVANAASTTFELTYDGNAVDEVSGTAVTTNALVKDQGTVFTVINSIKTKFNLHRVQSGVHLTNDTTNVISASNATSLSSALTLLTDVKANYNLHISDTDFHVVADADDVIDLTVPSGTNEDTFSAVVEFTESVAYKHSGTEYGVFNAHLQHVDTPTGFHSHGHNASAGELFTGTTADIVAHVGLNDEADLVVLESLTNTAASNVKVTGGLSLSTLGFTTNQTESRTQPSAAALSAALMNDSTFKGYAVANDVNVTGFGHYLRVDSLTTGVTSSITVSPNATSCFVEGTGLGIDATTEDYGENSVAGFAVTSSDTVNGSSGLGLLGQTYTDSRTGLRFTVLPPTAGTYSNGGSFTMVVGSTILCNSGSPTVCVAGLELTVSNTVDVEQGSTAVVTTYPSGGSEPQNGSFYYVSYYYNKTDYSTQLYTDLKKIQASFGDPTPDNPLSLAARLAILNGAVIVGLRQVKKNPNSATAPVSAYLAAIDDLQKPLSGNIKPDIIVPLTPDPVVSAALNQHCIFMSSPRMEGERTGVVGVGLGTTPNGVSSIAKGISSELMTVVYPDSLTVIVSDALGNTTSRLVDSTYAAAALAGSTCSPAIDVATPWTRRVIQGFTGLGRLMDPTEANQVAVSGVTILEQAGTTIRVRHGLTTRVDSVITRTPSVQLTIQYVQQQIRAILDPFIGQKFTANIPKDVEIAVSAMFTNLIGAAIVGKVAGISATVDPVDPTVLRLEAIYVPVFPLEYIVAVLAIRVRI